MKAAAGSLVKVQCKYSGAGGDAHLQPSRNAANLFAQLTSNQSTASMQYGERAELWPSAAAELQASMCQRLAQKASIFFSRGFQAKALAPYKSRWHT